MSMAVSIDGFNVPSALVPGIGGALIVATLIILLFSRELILQSHQCSPRLMRWVNLALVPLLLAFVVNIILLMLS
ncbi:MAG: hypothetical protein SA339_03935 [Methanomassiliicoccus sp.]|nr:hypothetical protein [Methanomassiliicoccus sp.]